MALPRFPDDQKALRLREMERQKVDSGSIQPFIDGLATRLVQRHVWQRATLYQPN